MIAGCFVGYISMMACNIYLWAIFEPFQIPYSNFNYCPLIWHFCYQRLMNKIENIQRRTLRFVLNDYTFDYETLLNE